jgi:acetyl-CoA C-acetyltransferase
VNKVCGSGLKAVMLAARAVRADDAAIVVAGGMECMSGAPHLIRGARWGVKLGDLQVIDAMISDGLCDAFHRYHMGITGERVAEKHGVTREEADRFALASHQKAVSAIRQGRFDKEVLPVTVGDIVVTSDECPREDTSYERLSNLKPVFKTDGILTAGNSSQLSDGAAALVITSARKARERGITPLARIVDYASGGVAPEDIMEAPIPVVRSLLAKTAFTMDDIDLVECNEAYATSTLVIARELGIDLQKLNINGGAVALGHPIGCSGARILLTLLNALHHHCLKRGLATLCIGGGNAVAMIIERL